MSKFNKMVNTYKTAKKNGRSYEQQEYRDNLAHDLRNLRQYGDTWKDLANALSEHEKLDVGPKWNSKYLESLWKNRKVWKDVAEKLIEDWNWATVIKYIDKFKWLDWEIVIKLIINWDWEKVANPDVIKKFEWLNKDVAKELINIVYEREGYIPIPIGCEAVAFNIDKFEWLDEEIAEGLIERQFGYRVLDKLEKFQWLNWKKIANKLIESHQGWAVIAYIDKFEWLDEQIAEKLIRAWYSNYVIENPEKFWLKKEK